MAALNSVVCPPCNSRSPSLPLWLSHLRLVHRSDCDLSLRCPVDACSATYKKVNSFCSHMYRQYREIACTSTSATANPSHNNIIIMQNDSSGITEEHDSSSLINNPNMIEDLHNTTLIINPRRACAARVTVVVLCVCLSVCLFVCPRLFSDYRLRGGL